MFKFIRVILFLCLKRKKNNSLERKLLKHFRNNPDKEYNYKQVRASFEIKDY